MDAAKFKKFPLMGILRGVEAGDLESLIEASISGGLETLEITMNTEDAPGLIEKAVKLSRNRLDIGAGTVLNIDSLHSALSSGATFIVTPVLVKDVSEYCLKNNIPFFPGALTPKEIYEAWNKGATMVKVFPAKFFGPEYFREIKGPFNEVELLACGGVTPQNLKSYFSNGASAVSFGGSVFSRDLLVKKDFAKIAQKIKEYSQEVRGAMQAL